MMADLVDQHVAYDDVERLAGLAPEIEERPAIEKDHVDLRRGLVGDLRGSATPR